MPNGGLTDGIMPPFPLGVIPYVPILGLTYRRTPALLWYEEAVAATKLVHGVSRYR